MRHSDCRGRAVTVLTQNQVGFTATGIVSLGRVGAVQQNHHVGVLLEGTGLTKVGDLRTLVGSLLGTTVELTDRDNRNFELLRQKL